MKLKFFSYGDPAEEIAAPDRAILGALTEEDWDKLTPFTGRRQYPAGAEIIRAGGTDRDIYMVISGRVQLVPPQASGLLKGEAETFGEGSVFGVASFLDGRPPAASAIATCPVEVLRLSADNFEQFSAWHPRIAIVLIRELGALLSGRRGSISSFEARANVIRAGTGPDNFFDNYTRFQRVCRDPSGTSRASWCCCQPSASPRRAAAAIGLKLFWDVAAHPAARARRRAGFMAAGLPDGLPQPDPQ
jgi:hypothetical protein